MELSQLKLTKRMLEKCAEANLTSVYDVLRHVPFRYESIQTSAYEDWKIGDKVWLEGSIIEPFKVQHLPNKRSMSKFVLDSPLGYFNVTMFNRPWLKLGMRISLQARYDGKHQLTGLAYNTTPLNEQIGLVPIYHSSKLLTQKDWIKLTRLVLDQLEHIPLIEIPQHLSQAYRLMALKKAYQAIHLAPNEALLHQAQRTLKYEEFLRFQTKLRLNRLSDEQTAYGVHKIFDQRLVFEHVNTLPFQLSLDQSQVLREVLDHLQSKQRMNRLLQGDVGSGKTVIAAMAMYATVLAHYQAAMMVPTEILARQHLKTLRSYLPAQVRVELLISALSPKERRDLLARLEVGEVDIVVGTHALIQNDVVFKNCGLVVADEQHRFGVAQRRLLSQKGDKVDFLLMSATPIPRTLAAVLYNDMDVSSIINYHASKATTHTELILENSVRSIYPRLLERIAQHDQVYVVCPTIDENNDSELKNVNSITHALKKVLPSAVRIGTLHGRLSASEKETVLERFYAHQLDVLVTTTVIEVGVDVAQANTMVIYDADRFGLSQLHQLRGRIGRAQTEGLCFLLSDAQEPKTLERLNVLVNNRNGFDIANKDLELRGPGELFGLKQSGLPSFRIANVILDQAILKTAQHDAQALMNRQETDVRTWIQSCQEELQSQSMD